MNRKDEIIDTAEIKMDNLPKDEAFALTTRLAELGYSVTSEVKNFSSFGGDTYNVKATKVYVVNNDPAETKLFNKFIDTFQKAVDLLSKGNGVHIEIDHSVGAIDIDISPKNLKNDSRFSKI